MNDTANGPNHTEERLTRWGWNDDWARKSTARGGLPAAPSPPAPQAALGPPPRRVQPAPSASLIPGRVIRHVHHRYQVVTYSSPEPVWAEVSGAFSYRAAGPVDYPTAGDWVLHSPDGRIEHLLPRASAISRNAAGQETREQVIAANVDVVFLVFGLDGGRNFTVGMLERSLVAAWNSGARPVVVLNKADCADADATDRLRAEAVANAPGASVHVVSAHRGDGLAELLAEARPGETVGMLGKSGVGKSALLNAFVQRATPDAPAPARTGELRESDLQGRHTTTDKVLHMLPNGVILADVPGLRELQLWADGDQLSSAFPEIEELATECRFGDCTHNGEPGCRVAEALAGGELPAERFDRYRDYQRELAFLARRKDQRAAAEEQKKWKQIAMEQRRFKGRRDAGKR